jgi:hypothetical protein
MTEDDPENECENSQLQFEANGVKVRLAGRHALIAVLALLLAYVVLTTV